MATQSIFPSILTAVTRVLDEVGISSPTALVATANRNSRVTVNALNDALEDIYVRTDWPWLRETVNIGFIVGQSEYPLPNRFGNLDGYLKAGSFVFRELTPYEFERDVLRVPTPDNLTGIYGVFCIDNHTLRFGHIPTDATVASIPKFTLTYLKKIPPRLSGDTDCLDLPPEFYRAVVFYARSRVKQLLEYPDAMVDMQEYERALGSLLAAKRQGFRAPVIKGPFSMGRSR